MSLGLASALTGIVFIGMGLGLRLSLKEPSRAITYLRHKPLTLGLYSLACLWFLFKILHLGEADFGAYKHLLCGLFATLACLAYHYVPDFLLVRALSILGLLSAHSLLEAAYMQESKGRLYLAGGIYVGIVLCLVLGALPFLARNAFLWLGAKPLRYKSLAYGLILYGIVLELNLWACKRV